MLESAKNSLDTRGKILLAARELFARYGFVGTKTSRIAETAGVNEALIYRYFPAKKDLYTAILQAQIADEDHVNLVRAAECQGLPVVDALRLVAERYLHVHDPTFLRLYYHSALEGHPLAGEFYEQFVRRFMVAVEQLLKRGVDEGIFRPLEPGLIALAFTGMFRSYVLTRELFPGKDFDRPDAEVSRAFCDTFLSGIKN
jgi:AcrR family transcriptional regulator